jgi:hypothetical protein
MRVPFFASKTMRCANPTPFARSVPLMMIDETGNVRCCSSDHEASQGLHKSERDETIACTLSVYAFSADLQSVILR